MIDGGNTHYVDDIRRSKALAARDIHYVDVGTSGGVFGLERGYCMMIGGEREVVQRLSIRFSPPWRPASAASSARLGARGSTVTASRVIFIADRAAPATS